MKEKLLLPVVNFARKNFRNTWIHRIPLTSWMYKKVFRLIYGTKTIEITFRSNRYEVPTKDVTVVPSMISGTYEQYELDIFKKLLKPGYTVLDIGANLGVYGIEASRKVGAKGRIYAFEPVKENQEFIEKNIVLNKVKNIILQPLAVGKKTGKLKIYKAENSVATHTAGAISDNFEEVDMISIDDFIRTNKIKVDFIKMDIEGGEGVAIEGGMKMLKSSQPILFIEFSSHHLKQCGYSPSKHAKNLLGLYEYCYLIDEKKKGIQRMSDAGKLSKLYNGNLILSSEPIAL